MKSKFSFECKQALPEGTFRRYIIPDYLHSNKGNSILLKEAYDIFKNIGSFDGYKVYQMVFSFAVSPKSTRLDEINICFDEDIEENEKFITTLIKCIDIMELYLTLGVVWTYSDKQQGRKDLNSWKKEVLKDNVCACCGGTKHLEAHHIFGFANNEDLRDDPNNGIALCEWCHKKYHSYYPGDANPKDLIDFFKRFGGLNG